MKSKNNCKLSKTIPDTWEVFGWGKLFETREWPKIATRCALLSVGTSSVCVKRDSWLGQLNSPSESQDKCVLPQALHHYFIRKTCSTLRDRWSTLDCAWCAYECIIKECIGRKIRDHRHYTKKSRSNIISLYVKLKKLPQSLVIDNYFSSPFEVFSLDISYKTVRLKFIVCMHRRNLNE